MNDKMKLLTTREFAKFLRVGIRTIYRMIDRNDFKFGIYMNREWRFDEQDVIKWIESMKGK